MTAVILTMIAAESSLAREACDVPAHPNWTKAEAWAWRQLCAGRWANFNRDGETLDPRRAKGWNAQRVVSSAFVEQLLTEPYAPVIDRHGIRMRGAWFKKGLNVREAATSFPLRCVDCRLAALNAEDAVIGGQFDLYGSVVERNLILRRARIESAVFLGGYSVVKGTLDADSLTTSSDVFLGDGSTFADVILFDADIGGILDLTTDSDVTGSIDAERITVAGDMRLGDESRYWNIHLDNAEIGGALVLSGSEVVGELIANEVNVASDVVMDDGASYTYVDLIGTDIGGWIILRDASWHPEGALDLRDAQADALRTDGDSDSWPATIWLNGFTFDRWADPNPPTLGSVWFTDTFLARLDTFSPGPYDQLAAAMDAQGHRTIAADIRYSRSDIERLEVPSGPDRWGREMHRAVLGYGLRPWWAAGWFAVVWCLGITVLLIPGRLPQEKWRRLRFLGRTPGWTWLRRAIIQRRRQTSQECDGAPVTAPSQSVQQGVTDHLDPGCFLPIRPCRPVRAPRWRVGQAAIFSLDRLLPAAKLADLEAFPTLRPWQRGWMWFEQLAGWTLTLFIVGWLGGLLV